MKNKSKKMDFLNFATLFVMIFSFTFLQAQESVNTSGKSVSDNGGSVSYSIGQIVYQTSIQESGSVAEGVQQAYEISDPSSIQEDANSHLLISVFPNPTSDFLTLAIEETDIENFSYFLYDMHGRLVKQSNITQNQVHIQMEQQIVGTYFLKIYKENQSVRTFKIVKR